MNVLLLRPVPGNERFGLGPFFRIEPLGMEYIAAALEARGHEVTLADLRFSRPLEQQIRVSRPGLIGIAAMHALETDDVVALAARVRRHAPEVPIVVGGHTAAAYPQPFLTDPIDAVIQDDGERVLPRAADALAAGRPLRGVPGFTVRERSIESVCRDFASSGDHLFIADDLFWYHPPRSLALAQELRRRGIRKRWILVQSRVDLVARNAELLEAWRPLAKEFDIFFGLEAATDEGLTGLKKDATVDQTAQGIAVARTLGYGVTGNFVIDPDWQEVDFENLWAFVERHQLFQAGFTILTPLPGTSYFEEMRSRVASRPWSHFDMHHLLWEPALGPQRFFELYCETWRRSVLNLRGRKSLWRWMREVDPRNLLFLLRALQRTQRMMSPEHY